MLYDARPRPQCSFCKQIGHSYFYCLGRESEPDPSQQCVWTNDLLHSDKYIFPAPNTPDPVDLDHFFDLFHATGTQFNKGNPYADSPDPVFRLRSRLGFWKALGANKQVLSWLSYGVKNRFFATPPRMEHSNWPDLEKVLKESPNPNWLTEELDRNLKLERLFLVEEHVPAVVHPIGVQVSTKLDGSVKFRKLDDARLCNAHEASMAHKFETLDDCASFIDAGDDLWGIDLTDFYYQIPLHPSSQPFACFTPDGSTYYCSRVLLMGMKPATFWVTKINRPVVAFFRSLKVKCSNYIDDWLGADHPDRAEAARLFMFKVLEALAWVPHQRSQILRFVFALAHPPRYSHRRSSPAVSHPR